MEKIRLFLGILLLCAACGKTELDIKPPPTCPPCKPVVSHLPMIDAVYFVDSAEQKIHQYRLNPANPSQPIPMIPPHIPTGENPSNLVIHPTKKWAYVLATKNQVIQVYDINQLTGHMSIAHTVHLSQKPEVKDESKTEAPPLSPQSMHNEPIAPPPAYVPPKTPFKDVATHLTMDLDGTRLYAVSDLGKTTIFYPFSINDQNGIPDYIGN